MDWNLLKLFLAVQKYQSLSAAAKALGMSHTTAFRHLNALEEQLGARLFERMQGRYELTELGRECLAIARPAGSAFEDLQQQIKGRDQALKGMVRLTAPTSFACHLLPHHLHHLSNRYPDIQVELLVDNHPVEMNERTADIALRVAKHPPTDLVGRQIRSIGWSAYAGTNYVAQFGLPQAGDLAPPHRFIGATGQLTTRAAYEWLEQQYGGLVTQRCDDLMTMASFARAEMGIAIVPDDLAGDDLQRCFPVPEAGNNTLWILTHPGLRKVERIRIVLRFLADALQKDPRIP